MDIILFNKTENYLYLYSNKIDINVHVLPVDPYNPLENFFWDKIKLTKKLSLIEFLE